MIILFRFATHIFLYQIGGFLDLSLILGYRVWFLVILEGFDNIFHLKYFQWRYFSIPDKYF